jgi:hypothetical protein
MNDTVVEEVYDQLLLQQYTKFDPNYFTGQKQEQNTDAFLKSCHQRH